MGKRRNKLPDPFEVSIEGLSHEGRGIARHNGKTIFVFAALPGERVLIRIEKSRRKYAEASVVEVIESSPLRVEPLCPHFSVCGGCSMQHVDGDVQVQLKQDSVLEMMRHAGVEIENILPALRSQPWAYRRKARLGVKYVIKKERLLIGFRERNKPYLADMQSCRVLVQQVGEQLPLLMQLIEGMDACQTIAQIEVAADDANTVLVFRHLEALSGEDRSRLESFARESGFWVQLQPAGPDSIHPLYPAEQNLYFQPLPDQDIRIRFGAADFTQVNNGINQQMVRQAIELLQLEPHHRVLDLFCGLGNFTLPIAGLAHKVTGIEGDDAMVERARISARENGVENSEYFRADLTEVDDQVPWLRQTYDRILLDPPRSGAMEIVTKLPSLGADIIVYVSCQPSSLARDARLLCDAGYRVSHFGLMDMFPQTAHVESMAVFRK